MENILEPEVETASDNFVMSDETGFKEDNRAQSYWGELSTDEQNYLDKKGMKTPVELLRSYRALEKAFSSKISLPKDGDEDALNKLFMRLGMPEKVDDFELSINKIDEGLANDFKKVCFDNHIMPKSAQKLYDWFNKNREEQEAQYQTERLNQSALEMEEQKMAWGDKSERNMELMKRGVRLFLGNDDTNEISKIEEAIGTAKTMQIFAKLGEAISEDNPVSFGGKSGALEVFDSKAFYREMFHDY